MDAAIMLTLTSAQCSRYCSTENHNLVGWRSIMQMRTEDNRMSVNVIAQGKVENLGLLDQYVEKVSPTIKSHQGQVVAFDEEPEVAEGAD